MQTDLVSRIEKLWAMAEIALQQGSVEYATHGHTKTAKISGMRFRFIDDTLVRVRSSRLDIVITHKKPSKDVVFFPGANVALHYLIGDDEVLDRVATELASLNRVFSIKKAA